VRIVAFTSRFTAANPSYPGVSFGPGATSPAFTAAGGAGEISDFDGILGLAVNVIKKLWFTGRCGRTVAVGFLANKLHDMLPTVRNVLRREV